MKKIYVLMALLVLAISAHAGNYNVTYMNQEVINIIATLIFFILVIVLVLALLEKILNYRIKNKIVDKGISEVLATSILQTKSRNLRPVSIKWFCLLSGTGVGLMIVHYTQPLGIHSLAIMAISIAVSFLGYFYYLKQSEN